MFNWQIRLLKCKIKKSSPWSRKFSKKDTRDITKKTRIWSTRRNRAPLFSRASPPISGSVEVEKSWKSSFSPQPIKRQQAATFWRCPTTPCSSRRCKWLSSFWTNSPTPASKSRPSTPRITWCKQHSTSGCSSTPSSPPCSARPSAARTPNRRFSSVFITIWKISRLFWSRTRWRTTHIETFKKIAWGACFFWFLLIWRGIWLILLRDQRRVWCRRRLDSRSCSRWSS